MKKYDFNQLEEMQNRVMKICYGIAIFTFITSLIIGGIIDIFNMESLLLICIGGGLLFTAIYMSMIAPLANFMVFGIIDTIQDEIQKKQDS